VIDQTRRLVLEGERVPTAETVYSIFEPHSDLIRAGESASGTVIICLHAGRLAHACTHENTYRNNAQPAVQ
jgi:hypothetical protein